MHLSLALALALALDEIAGLQCKGEIAWHGVREDLYVVVIYVHDERIGRSLSSEALLTASTAEWLLLRIWG